MRTIYVILAEKQYTPSKILAAFDTQEGADKLKELIDAVDPKWLLSVQPVELQASVERDDMFLFPIKWQPIDTAPKTNGPEKGWGPIIALSAHEETHLGYWLAKDGSGPHGWHSLVDHKPIPAADCITHWWPIPDGPGAA